MRNSGTQQLAAYRLRLAVTATANALPAISVPTGTILQRRQCYVDCKQLPLIRESGKRIVTTAGATAVAVNNDHELYCNGN
jgi:hypothetical protein